MPPSHPTELAPYVFYRDDRCVVYCGDNREILALLPRDSVDIVITSPPYNTNIVGNGKVKPSGMMKERGMAKWLDKMTTGYTDALDEQTYQDQQVELLDALYKVMVPNGSIMYNHKIRWREKQWISPMQWLTRSQFRMRTEIVWDRGVGTTLNARMVYQQDERIYWMYKGDDWRWNQEAVGLGTVWRIAPQKYKEHSCVFPEALVSGCIRCVYRPGDTILDPYAGSGTVGAVAQRFGCFSILIEREERYCDVIVDRFKQPSLLDYYQADAVDET